jgi:hypothetical protein
MRQERVRRENPHSNDWRNDQSIQEASPEEYATSIEHENTERTAEAHENFERLRSLDEIFIGKRIAERGRGNVADYCCMASYNGYQCSCNQ